MGLPVMTAELTYGTTSYQSVAKTSTRGTRGFLRALAHIYGRKFIFKFSALDLGISKDDIDMSHGIIGINKQSTPWSRKAKLNTASRYRRIFVQ
jgi:hypothetical protein